MPAACHVLLSPLGAPHLIDCRTEELKLVHYVVYESSADPLRADDQNLKSTPVST